ncbi:MAG: hypothetical protein RIC55_03720 [Pirellulaceae bacterium]
MNTRCPSCNAAIAPGETRCQRCGCFQAAQPIDAILVDQHGSAASEQGLDTLYVGLGLFALGALVFAGGMIGFVMPVMNDGFSTIDFDTFIVGMAVVTGLTTVLFITAAVVFAVSRGPAAARAGGVAGAVVGSVLSGVASVLVVVVVVIVVICATILAMIVSLMNACGCKVNSQQADVPPPSASGYVARLD